MHDLHKAGKYEILERIGEGGFGVVYKGRDPFIKRSVAIKTCTSSSEETRRRFLREAEIAGNIEHPNITVVYDFGFQDEVPYLVQEFLSGEDLDHVIERRDRLSLSGKLTCLLQAASGLGFAHEQGITHRDIKPSNLRILEDGRVKIMDFGIAKVAGVDTQLTQTGTTLGTPAYLSPEQLRGDAVDQRSDIYSFGVLAFELLTYRRLFDADTISSLFYQILHQTPQRLRTLWPEAPQEVDDLIAACVAKSPDDRPQTFEPIVRRLEQALSRLEGEPDKFYPQEPVKEAGGVDPEHLRQEAMTAARNHIENLLASGQLDAASRALDEAQGSFGDQVPFRTLHDRLLSLRQSGEISPEAVTGPTPAPTPEAPSAPLQGPTRGVEIRSPAGDAPDVDLLLGETRQLVHDNRLTLAEEKLEGARSQLGERPELLAVSRQIKLRRRLEEGRRAIQAGDLLAAGRLLEHASDIDPESTELLHLRSELHSAVARAVDESDGAQASVAAPVRTESDPGAPSPATPSAAAGPPANAETSTAPEPQVTLAQPPVQRADLSEAPTVLTTWEELEKQRPSSEENATREATPASTPLDQSDTLSTNPLPVADLGMGSRPAADSSDPPPATQMLAPDIADAARAPRSGPITQPSANAPPRPAAADLPVAPLGELSDLHAPAQAGGSTRARWLIGGVIALVAIVFLLQALGGGQKEDPAPPVEISSVSVLLDATPWATLQEIRTPGGDGEPIELGPIVVSSSSSGAGDEIQRSTPLRLRLAPGAYEFVLRHPQAAEPFMVHVDVPAQETFRFDATVPNDDGKVADRYLQRLGITNGAAP